MGNSNQITVSTELGDVVVRKMPLSNYAELLRALDKLPEQLENFVKGKTTQDLKSFDTGELVKVLPELLASSWGSALALLAVPTDKDPEFLGKLDGADAIEIIDAILELNDFARIANAVKKIVARRAKMATPPTL